VLSTAQLIAQKYGTERARIDYAKKNIAYGLRSENNGVVESVLILVAKLKMSHPPENIANLLSIVDSLSTSGESGVLRYKAYIISNICADPAWFAEEDLLHMPTPDQFFVAAARRLENKMLGISSR